MTPTCPYCHKPMKLLLENETSKQYVCSCRGSLYYQNVHKQQKGKDDGYSSS